MIKKILSLLLSAALTYALCASAFAASSHMSNFQKSASYNRTFRDVSTQTWYAPSVRTCYEYGLMNGTKGLFHPQDHISIAESIAIAARIHNIYTNGKFNIPLKTSGAWYIPYVNYAIAHDIIPEDAFSDYTADATRADIAYIFVDALPPAELHAINDIAHLPDVDNGKYYFSVLMLYNAGILTGNGPECSFRPGDTITRAEISAIAARVILPDQRKNFTMLDAHNMHTAIAGLTVYMPGEVSEAGDTITSTSGQYRCEVLLEVDALFGMEDSIETLTKKEGKEHLSALLSAKGYTIDNASVRPITAAFGSVPVYGYRFHATDSDGNSRLGFGYAFLQNGQFCSVSFLTLADSKEFRSVIAVPSLHGSTLTQTA